MKRTLLGQYEYDTNKDNVWFAAVRTSPLIAAAALLIATTTELVMMTTVSVFG